MLEIMGIEYTIFSYVYYIYVSIISLAQKGVVAMLKLLLGLAVVVFICTNKDLAIAVLSAFVKVFILTIVFTVTLLCKAVITITGVVKSLL